MVKKIVKKLFVMAMAVTVATTAVPTMSVNAAISAPEQVWTVRGSKKNDSYHSFYVGGLTKSTKITPTSLKSSKKSVIAPWYMEKYQSTYEYTTTYLDEDGKVTGEPNKYGNTTYAAYVGFRVKKAGSANLSYKIGGKTYTTKVTAKAYKNPIKTAKIAGIKNGSSTNLASKLNNENYANLKMNANKNNATVQFVANSGWKIREISVSNRTEGSTYRISNYNKGVGSKTLNIGNVKKKDVLEVEVYVVNDSDNTSMYCNYYINQN